MKQGVLITLASALLACGSDTTIFADPAGSTGSGGANAGGSGSGASGTGGAGASTGGGGAGEGGAGECVPGSTMRCYGGPDGTAGVGICTAGVATCNRDGTGYGRCEGEVLPATEDCNAAADEDCDGLAPPCSTGTHL